MNITKTISPRDRDFFMLVWKAVFTNPFSEERAELDKKISGADHPAPRRGIVPEAMQEIARRIAILDHDKAAKIQDFKKSDQELMEHVFLFDIYHKFNTPFDEFIEKQIAAGDESLAVPFAKDAMATLTARGFTLAAAARYLAFFYQIRRAFYFIYRGLIGQSASMQSLRMNLWNNIFTHNIRHYEQTLWNRMEDFSTLLLGPTGSGKGAAAAAIGRSGFIPFDEKKQTFVESFTKTFVPINLSQFPETLLESELFGHTKGAFTGAVGSHEGLFSLCGPHGSVFLDEIGEVSLAIQVKLLHILEERLFSPVGSHERIRFSGRVIAATNRPLEELRREGTFRDDFYYRLCSDCIYVSGLQKRIEENPHELDELVAHTVRQITGEESQQLVETVLDVIDKKLGKNYPWPGNVRELAQCVRRIIIKRDYQGEIAARAADSKSALLAGIESGTFDAETLLNTYCKLLYQKYGTYEEVARKTKLDRRTVKKHLQ
jgi:sigma-54 dependent transcriptional regulator, flagellar regulatory protein